MTIAIRVAHFSRCRICDQWKARDWLVDAWPAIHIVRVCGACRAVETQCR